MKLVIASLVFFFPLAVFGQNAPAPALPPTALPQRTPEAGGDLLGEKYESRTAGISLQLPVGCTQVHASGENFAEFQDAQRGWSLKMSELRLSSPTAIGNGEDSGLLAQRTQQLRSNTPGAQILRSDKINVGAIDVGMIAMRAPIGLGWRLTQQAIVQASPEDFYIIALLSPGGKQPAEGEVAEVDPREKLAADTFSAMVDTIKLLDRSQLHDEQVQRLFETHSLFLSFTPERLTRALMPQQKFRIIQDGAEIGTSTISEVPEKHSKWDGLLVTTDTQRKTKDISVTGESKMFCSLDRHHEEWTAALMIIDRRALQPERFSEIGISDRDDRQVEHKPIPGEQTKSTTQVVEGYDLSVTNSQLPQTLKRVGLPAYYVQQAIVEMFPRLLPLDRPRKYMIATYVPEQREVMLRYYDVEEPREVNLGGKQVTAVPISDRIGYDSQPTIHYMGLDGKYLGSINSEARTMVLAVDPLSSR